MAVTARTFSCGEVCIFADGLFGADLQSLCGRCWGDESYQDSNDAVTCATCKAVYDDIKKSRKKIIFST